MPSNLPAVKKFKKLYEKTLHPSWDERSSFAVPPIFTIASQQMASPGYGPNQAYIPVL
jgi:hypothetical protein